MTFKDLQVLLKKALVYNLMINIDKILEKENISHLDLSRRTGRAGNWFNDAKNNNEDVRISTVARILAAIQLKQEKVDMDTTEILKGFFSKRVFEVSEKLNNVMDGEGTPIQETIQLDKDFYQDLIGDWASIDKLGDLKARERLYVDQISNWLK